MEKKSAPLPMAVSVTRKYVECLREGGERTTVLANDQECHTSEQSEIAHKRTSVAVEDNLGQLLTGLLRNLILIVLMEDILISILVLALIGGPLKM